MPFLRLQTSLELDPERCDALLRSLSAVVAKGLSKPESYMMVSAQDRIPMRMSGNDAPAAFVEIRSVGSIRSEQAASLCAKLTEILVESLGLSEDRIYFNFQGIPGELWGMGRGTFG